MRRLVLAVMIQAAVSFAEAQEASRGADEVFQFVQKGVCANWSDGSSNQATAYLWIPENASRVRGVLILCANVPEGALVVHPEIRRVCRENALAIVWCPQSFMNWARALPGKKKMSEEYATTVGFLQTLLDGLAEKSGYGEVASAPWFPIGESGHLLMVDTLVEEKPERCAAALFLKNNHLPPKNRTVPTLVVFGSAQEWGQDKVDIRTNWNQVSQAYAAITGNRERFPEWALSYVLDGHSGHFDCSEKVTTYVAGYLEAMAKRRLPEKEGEPLRPVDLTSGYFADLAIPGRAAAAPMTASIKETALPWFPTLALALDSQRFSAIRWDAATQFPVYLDDAGNVLPHSFNGIVLLKPLVTSGGLFEVRGEMASAIPDDFANAGAPLPKSKGPLEVLLLSGPFEKWDGGKFRIRLNRNWPHEACYVALRKDGDENTRTVVQPAGVDLKKMRIADGRPQKIQFDEIADVSRGTAELALRAHSDAGLPVLFFVVAGPAYVAGQTLYFTGIPPRCKLPIEVTVAAWNWGRAEEPKVQTADIVTRRFLIRP